jgi:hypothetical protein
MRSYWEENWGWIITVSIMIMMLFVMLMVIVFSSPVVTIDLVNANGDLSGGPQAFEFKVEEKEMASFTSVRVIGSSLNVEVIKFPSGKLVDKIDIVSLLRNGDLVTSEFFAKTSSQEETLNICIKHLDGKVNKVSVNIK